MAQLGEMDLISVSKVILEDDKGACQRHGKAIQKATEKSITFSPQASNKEYIVIRTPLASASSPNDIQVKSLRKTIRRVQFMVNSEYCEGAMTLKGVKASKFAFFVNHQKNSTALHSMPQENKKAMGLISLQGICVSAIELKTA